MTLISTYLCYSNFFKILQTVEMRLVIIIMTPVYPCPGSGQATVNFSRLGHQGCSIQPHIIFKEKGEGFLPAHTWCGLVLPGVPHSEHLSVNHLFYTIAVIVCFLTSFTLSSKLSLTKAVIFAFCASNSLLQGCAGREVGRRGK